MHRMKHWHSLQLIRTALWGETHHTHTHHEVHNIMGETHKHTHSNIYFSTHTHKYITSYTHQHKLTTYTKPSVLLVRVILLYGSGSKVIVVYGLGSKVIHTYTHTLTH